jgi:hypothetical protein
LHMKWILFSQLFSSLVFCPFTLYAKENSRNELAAGTSWESFDQILPLGF